jgi:ATP-dependent Clp protease ATP-binding subunit ClpB
MNMTSLPEDLVSLEKEISQLEIEKQALIIDNKKKDETRVIEIEKTLADLKETTKSKRADREVSRKLLLQTKELKEQLKALDQEAIEAERQTDYNKVAEIRHAKIPAIHTQLKEIDKNITTAIEKGDIILKDYVDTQDIAQIIAKRTGIPATKLIQSESDKLTHLEALIKTRVIGQDEAIHSVANAIRRARA